MRATPILMALLVLGAAPWPQPAAAHGKTASATLAMRWQVTGLETDPVTHKRRSHARIILTNTTGQPLPAGWRLWFTAIADTTGADPLYPLRHIAGGLYAITPDASLPPVPPGATITIAITHPGEFVMNDKGPQGPYVTLPGSPARIIAVGPVARQIYSRATPGASADLFTDPAAVWAANRAVASVAPSAIPPVLPAPKAWTRDPGGSFDARLARPNRLRGLASENALARIIATRPRGGPHRRAPVLPFRIAIGPVPGETSPESYALTISRHDGIRLIGTSPAGLFYALQSLDQILHAARQSGTTYRLNAITITDAPRFAWRGLLLDPVRNFQKPAHITRMIALMARFKLNRLHLHLSDDEGWRLAIPALPELTAIGAKRGACEACTDHLPPADGSGPWLDDPHGTGWFTTRDYLALLRAAKARHIEVIPEIDMPGHARAAIRAMAARAGHIPGERGAYRLDDPADRSAYQSPQGYDDNAMNPGLAASDRFIATVITHIARLHRLAGTPLRHMHLGGDELPPGVWQGSPAARARLAKLGGADAADGGHQALRDDMFDRATAIVRAAGAAPIGWEEMGLLSATSQPTINPHFAHSGLTVQIWNNLPGAEGLANLLANGGYQVITSPARSLYFDMAQASDPDEPGQNWAGFTTLGDVYDYDPLAPQPGAPPLTPAGQTRILGVEGTLFSETVREAWRMDYMLMPRLLALAERAWAPAPAWTTTADPAAAKMLRDKGRAIFLRQVGTTALPLASARTPALHYRLPPPGALAHDGQLDANAAWPGLTLRYTTDGHIPGATSPVLPHPFTPPPGRPITIASFARDGQHSPPLTLEPSP